MSEPPQAVRRVRGVALDTLRNNDGSELHSAVRELADKALCGKADRRSVLRVLAWLGVSAVAARGVLGESAGARGAAGQAVGASGQAPGAAGQAPKSGGTLRFVCSIQQMTDPARSEEHTSELQSP